ncbi:NUDIX hydrolase [Thermomonospora umbrina]|uniref:ADP-ribose pyrophosphatase YjhB (NUDIX family) n=1 Tax=Thermomonospora umbrina TaxID=111806 RepID=A0A3D9T686_9ACTN|nr:NUDIX hydrolase [Thermomonospora umbrina]REF00195.1 ADP-ribose pyrophosphatase YjhB (NUDIX family) [Thermomonospora umbrina]
MHWTTHGERSIYASPWMDVRLADVELPDGRRFDHHLVRVRPSAGVAAVDADGRVLLIWRHRFICDAWGWEIPGGRLEEGEDPAETAARELEEETGWRAGPLHHLVDLHVSPGVTDGIHHIFRADGAVLAGEPTDVEAERIEWVPLTSTPELIARGEIGAASTAAALLYLMTGACGNGAGPG